MTATKAYDSTQTVRTRESIKLMDRLTKKYPGNSPHQLRRAMLAIGSELVKKDLTLVLPHLTLTK